MLEQSSQHGKRKGRRRREKEREKVVLRSSRIRRGGDNTVNGHRITPSSKKILHGWVTKGHEYRVKRKKCILLNDRTSFDSIRWLSLLISYMANYHAWKETSNEPDKCNVLVRSSIRWSSSIGTYLEKHRQRDNEKFATSAFMSAASNKRSVLFDAIGFVTVGRREDKSWSDVVLCHWKLGQSFKLSSNDWSCAFFFFKSFEKGFIIYVRKVSLVFFYRLLDEILWQWW